MPKTKDISNYQNDMSKGCRINNKFVKPFLIH